MRVGQVRLGKTAPLALTDEQHERFKRLVHERFGLHFSDKRRVDLDRGVLHAFAATNCSSLDEFYHLLLEPASSAIMEERLVNALTICETHFFRDASQFDALQYHILPQIIERKRSLRNLRVWSVGCASGEEPYSIAILLRELLPDISHWSITIIGTDINTQALDRARRAVYTEWAFREDRAHKMRQAYFARQDNGYVLTPEIRRMVTFSRLNLMEDVYPSYSTNTTYIDLILCRNVTIYFPQEVTQQVIDRLYMAQTDGGWLVVGHSEPSMVTYRRYQVRNFTGAIIYQRVDSPEAPNQPLFPFDDLSRPIQSHARSQTVQPPMMAANHSQKLVKPVTPVGKPPEEEEPALNPLAKARELLNSGRSEQARDILSEYVSIYSKDPSALTLLGQAYANLGCWEEAEKCCNLAIKLDCLARDAYYILALVLQHQDKVRPAAEAMKKVVYIDRKDVLGHFGLAELYHLLGMIPQAIKSLDNVFHILESAPDNTVIPNSGGITTKHLRDVVVHKQQQWSSGVHQPAAVMTESEE